MAIEKYRDNEFALDEYYRKLEENIFAKVGIRSINIRDDVFNAHADPLSLYFERQGHPNGVAKRLMTKAIARQLKSDGFMPGNH